MSFRVIALGMIGFVGIASACRSTQPPGPVVLQNRANQSLQTQNLGGDKWKLRLAKAKHVYSPQESDVWCWAACASMLYKLEGKDVPQKRIVERVQGVQAVEQERAASFFEIVKALTTEIEDQEFSEVMLSGFDDALQGFGDGYVPNKINTDTSALIYGYIKEEVTRKRDPAIDDLKKGYGALVGLSDPGMSSGHVYVMIGATFTEPDEELTRNIVQLDKLHKDCLEASYSLSQYNNHQKLWGWVSLPSWLRTSRDVLAANLHELEAQLEEQRGLVQEASHWHSEYKDYMRKEEAKLLFGHIGLDRYDTEEIVLLDPMEEAVAEAEVRLSGSEFLKRVDFVLSASDAKAIAEKWANSFSVKSKKY